MTFTNSFAVHTIEVCVHDDWDTGTQVCGGGGWEEIAKWDDDGFPNTPPLGREGFVEFTLTATYDGDQVKELTTGPGVFNWLAMDFAGPSTVTTGSTQVLYALEIKPWLAELYPPDDAVTRALEHITFHADPADGFASLRVCANVATEIQSVSSFVSSGGCAGGAWIDLDLGSGGVRLDDGDLNGFAGDPFDSDVAYTVFLEASFGSVAQNIGLLAVIVGDADGLTTTVGVEDIHIHVGAPAPSSGSSSSSTSSLPDPRVRSTELHGGSGQVTVTVDGPDGIRVCGVRNTASGSAVANNPPPSDNMSFPYGMTWFAVHNVPPGGTVTVTLEFPGPVDEFWKLINGTWIEVDATISGSTVTSELTDGGPYDASGEANGIIEDPVLAGIRAGSFTG